MYEKELDNYLNKIHTHKPRHKSIYVHRQECRSHSYNSIKPKGSVSHNTQGSRLQLKTKGCPLRVHKLKKYSDELV